MAAVKSRLLPAVTVFVTTGPPTGTYLNRSPPSFSPTTLTYSNIASRHHIASPPRPCSSSVPSPELANDLVGAWSVIRDGSRCLDRGLAAMESSIPTTYSSRQLPSPSSMLLEVRLPQLPLLSVATIDFHPNTPSHRPSGRRRRPTCALIPLR